MFGLGSANKMQEIRNKTKKLLSVYFSVNIVLCAVFFLYMGISFAEEGSEKVWHGEQQTLLYYEDAQNMIRDFFNRIRRGSTK